MKPLEYTSQEKKAIDAADSVVLRKLSNRKWVEITIFPSVGETLYQCLERIQTLVKTNKEYSRVVIYIGNDEMLACVPRGYIPDYIKDVFLNKGNNEDK